MAIQVNRVTNAAIFINGKSLLGKAEEISLPVIKHKTSDHKSLGMVGTMETWSGVDKMECKIKWNAFYPDVLKQNADPTKSVQIQVRASVEGWSGGSKTGEVPFVALMTAAYKDFPGGNFKQHDNVELETNLNVYSFKETIDGQDIIEIDIFSNIYKVDGKDILQQFRNNLGI